MSKIEPKEKRVAAFFDGQNLFRAAKESFGWSYPNYDPLRLSQAICSEKGWSLETVHFYTGIPDVSDSRHAFWTKKLLFMEQQGIVVFKRQLRYRNQEVSLPDGRKTTVLVGQEKGVDVRIALDIVRLARQAMFDVALIFSQDQDLSEVADEVRAISDEQSRWIKIASAFPFGPASRNRRGINGTDWIKIERTLYESCIDPNDYR
ncbi:MAG TPA: NYN domain-containing protein [bacterium]|nr:NYN domain-containing protein [bacterium]